MDDMSRDVAMIRSIKSVPSILEVICLTTGMGFAAVARVTDDKWVACEVLDNLHFGLEPGGELPLETTLCHEVRAEKKEIVFDNAAENPRFASHHTPRIYGLQSYISVPIILPDGSFFGTLCAIDPKPASLDNPKTLGMFRLFAELIAFHIDANNKLTSARAEAAGEREASSLREQFIAVLGHDLRNPLASINSGVHLLGREPTTPQAARILRHMGESVHRMRGLIDNLMDFARGRLGGGINLDLTIGERIEPVLAQVINEIKAGNPEREIETRFNLSRPVDADHARIAQMFSNLLSNAIAHGDKNAAILVDASIESDQFRLDVTNSGNPIPAPVLKKLFQPFYRGEVRPHMQGLGLGLYIAGEIVKAHGGTIGVTSDAAETRFTVHLPVEA